MSRRVKHVHAKPGEYVCVHRHRNHYHYHFKNSSSNDGQWVGWFVFLVIIVALVSC